MRERIYIMYIGINIGRRGTLCWTAKCATFVFTTYVKYILNAHAVTYMKRLNHTLFTYV